MEENEARFNISYEGENGDFVDPVAFDATDADLKAWASEAMANGDIPGLPATPNADFTDFVVQRLEAKHGEAANRILLRPKVPFGC